MSAGFETKESVKRAIEVLRELPKPPLSSEEEREKFSSLTKKLDGVAADLQVKADGHLGAFVCVDSPYWRSNDGAPHKVLLPIGEGVPLSLVNCVDRIWRMIGGNECPDTAFSIISAARCEFSRSQFHSVTSWLSLCSDPQFRPRGDAPRMERMLVETNWSSGNEVSRNPAPVWGEDCAARDFNEWLWRTSDAVNEFPDFLRRAESLGISSKVTADKFLYAIALSWMDEAVVDASKAIFLLAEAADAQDHAGCRMGWDMHAEYIEEYGENGKPKTVSALARHAANVRHASNRDRADRLRAAYQAGEFRSKDAAAEKLAPQFGLSFRAARDHLKGV